MAQRKIALGARAPRNVTFIDALDDTPSFKRPDREKYCVGETELKHRHSCIAQVVRGGKSVPRGQWDLPAPPAHGQPWRLADFGVAFPEWKDAKNFDGCWRNRTTGDYLLMEAKGHIDAGEANDVRAKLEDWHNLVARTTPPAAGNDLMWKRLNRKGPTPFTREAWDALPANYGTKVIVIGASITKTGWATLRDWFDARQGTCREAELWLFATPLEEADGFTHATRHSLVR